MLESIPFMKTSKNQKKFACPVSVKDLILPCFVIEGTRRKEPIRSMPGISRFTVDLLSKEISQARRLGIRSVILFGVCSRRHRNETGEYAYSPNSIVARAVAAIKDIFSDVCVMTDICLCAYMSHGHCGIVKKGSRHIDVKATLEALSKMAVTHARAGADWVAPSAMTHRQVRTLRRALDRYGFKKTKILGYSAKFASNFYGPFRDAADSAPQFGDRSGYQLHYADSKRALREIADDIQEGAAMVMVKPALSYLDILKEARLKHPFPLAAYNVSGEYAMVKQGAKAGFWDEKKMVFEILSSIKRAGADKIITYHAKDAAGWLKA